MSDSDSLTEQTFVSSRRFPYSASLLFGSFSNPTLLQQWWGPKGFTNTFHAFSFSENGRWHFTMHGPNGVDYDNESFFQEIITDHKIVIEHCSEPHFILTCTFIDHGSETELTWSMVFDSKKILTALLPIIKPANEENFDKLAQVTSSHNTR